MTTLYIDGDACPVKAEVARVATRYALLVYIVSNQGLRHNLGTHVQGILVGAEFDAADNWIVDHIVADDIVITSDIQLAARCLKKAAKALNPTGKLFSEDNIGSALAMRELSAYLREAGEIKGHNPNFSKQDRSQFLQTLDQIIQSLKNQ
jgi:hypothetical protein